jgi:putative ATP-dependent endonuclease of the OLD family
MLRIREIHITNFRSILDERFRLPALTVLVGKNDVGKSNLLGAIQILLEGTAGSVKPEDFYDRNSPVEIRAVMDGVGDYLVLCDERNRPKVAQRLDANGLLTIRRVAETPMALGDIEVLDPETGEFSTITGISAPLKPMLPEVIFIEALADVADQTKGTQKDVLGMLVNQVMLGIVKQVEPNVREAYREADKILNVQSVEGEERDERAPELRAVESEITGYLKETFPNSSVRLRVELASVKEILERVHVSIREGKSEDSYYRRGQGMQRTLYLSLLRAEAARIRMGQAVSRPFILLFEEPEAFLHPDGQTRMREALASISAAAQVVLTTHSPLMVTPDSLPHTVRIEKYLKDGYPRPVTRGLGPIDPENLTHVQRQLIPLFAIQRSSRFLFSRGVLLVEGTSDEHLFSAIAERLGRFRLDDFERAVVETGGKGNFEPFAEVLRMLGLQVWMLTDLDFLWNGAGTVLGGGDAEFAQFMQRLQAMAPAGGDGDELAKKRERIRRTEVCAGELSDQRDAICERLMMRGIFVLRQGEIEDYVGLGYGAKGRYLKAAEEIRAGVRPLRNQADLERILAALRAWAAPPVVLR